ncbi:MAG: hypothetical protein M1819_006983 [Sarea resinae]|nr:MAG: hypothetical protein M1819_006983 [Sarea resinae]
MAPKNKRDRSKATTNGPPTKRDRSTAITNAPPTKRASTDAEKNSKPKRKKRSRDDIDDDDDDTPKAFKRLMQFHATGRNPSGLDDGVRPPKNAAKKRKREDTAASTTTTTAPKANTSASTPHPPPAIPTAKTIPTIRPGEKMSEFSARVDAALPVSGLTSNRKDPLGLKQRQTKTEKRMQKMYAEWREEEARLQDRRDEAREQEEERQEELGLLPSQQQHQKDILDAFAASAALSSSSSKSKKKNKKGKKAKRARLIGETTGALDGSDDDDDDPWAKLARRDTTRPTSLHDVVQAPPQFSAVPREKFKVRGVGGAKVDVADVPHAAGSLRRREELGQARRAVVEGYRRLMEGRRAGVGGGGGRGGEMEE